MYYKANHDTIDYKSISLEKHEESSEPWTLFFISDVHTRLIKTSTLECIKEKVDVVVIGGDLVEKGVSLKQVQKNINILKSFGAPIYFVWGNNDYELDVLELTKQLESQGVHILKNSADNFVHNKQVISFIGLDCCKMREAKFIEGIEHANGHIKILITHHPKAFFELSASEIEDIDFALSGHTHGGQIRFFGIGPYSRGGYKKHFEKTMLISEGYGYTKLPLRLGTNAECHVITFE